MWLLLSSEHPSEQIKGACHSVGHSGADAYCKPGPHSNHIYAPHHGFIRVDRLAMLYVTLALRLMLAELHIKLWRWVFCFPCCLHLVVAFIAFAYGGVIHRVVHKIKQHAYHRFVCHFERGYFAACVWSMGLWNMRQEVSSLGLYTRPTSMHCHTMRS